MTLDFLKLQPMDYVLTTDISLFAGITRWTNAGAGKFFDTRIATHVGCLVDIPNQKQEPRYFICEMKPKGLFKPKHGLRLNSLDTYLDNGKLGERIVCIRRNPVYNDKAIQDKANYRAIQDACASPDYDTFALLQFIWPKVEDRPNKYYCSELMQHYAILDGNRISTPMREDDISPYGIQIANNLITVQA